MFYSNLFYVKISEFTKFQKSGKVEPILNPVYDTGSENQFVRKKPSGGIWGFSRERFLNFGLDLREYVILYTVGNAGKFISTNNMDWKYKSSTTRPYIRKIRNGGLDFNYENIAKDFAYVDIDRPEWFYSESTDNMSIDPPYPNILITNPSCFRLLCLASKPFHPIIQKRYDEYVDVIGQLNAPNMLKYRLHGTFGLHVNNGNFLSIDDIIFDIKTNNGKAVISRTPNLGNVGYAKFVHSLVEAKYLDKTYDIPTGITFESYNVKISKDKEKILVNFLDKHDIEYSKRKPR